ncbi:hypothetical protein DAPPUDRAFT_252301 [Daphnia pulex]|uniref:Uncharacterized protein n=1 Tax=Daphnia pulex TaxID=6669 RepID=E9H2F2_DAPPU|nr:hypothetical protein DAPPUDRAFT_252301 [Daphnia pulex]|eukprot:EFX74080.1 hypothetical protein DAPPUDRAFT_252301 [Daphnia pulex]
MKGRQTEQAIVAEYEHLVASRVPTVTESSDRSLPELDFKPEETIEIEFTIDDDGETVPLWETVAELAEELRQDKNLDFKGDILEWT